jgi:hypothetical protein
LEHWNKLSPTELPQSTEEEGKKKQKNFINYESSLTALELLMANTFKYKNRITVAAFSVTTKRHFLQFS